MQLDNDFLERLGYNPKDRAIDILRDLILEVADFMDRYEEEDIKSLINKKDSFIYIELACFEYEIGLKSFHKELQRLHKNRMDFVSGVSNKGEGISVEDVVFCVAKYIYTKEEKHNQKPKDKIKALFLINTLEV